MQKVLRQKDRMEFFRHVHEMVDSGLTTVDAVNNFTPESKDLKKAIGRVSMAMRKGVGFSEALTVAGLAAPLEKATLAAGERSGNLEAALSMIVRDLEENVEFMSNLKQSLTMPLMNVCAALGAVFYLALSVLPKVGNAFKDFGGLPPLSLKIFAAAELFGKYWYVPLIAMAGTVGALVYVWKTKPPFLYTLPVVGRVLNYFFLSVLFGGLSMSQRAGFSILDGLSEIEPSLVGFTKLKVRDIIKEMRRGAHLDMALGRIPAMFPRDIVGMVRTARVSGNYDRIIPSVAKLCRSRSYQLAKKIATMAEPAVIVIVACAVLVLALSIYYPIATVGTDFSAPGR